MEFLTNNVDILLIIISIVSVAFGVIYGVIPLLTKKGVDVKGAIKDTDTILNTADHVIDTAKYFFPGVPALEAIDKILDVAQKGVNAAEQLYKTSQIAEEQRKEEATKFVYNAITAAGVEITDEMKKIIDGAIEAAVFALPKTHEEIDA